MKTAAEKQAAKLAKMKADIESAKQGPNVQAAFSMDTNPAAPDAHGLPLSPVRRRNPADLKANLENPFDPLPADRFDLLKSDIQENGVLVSLLARKDGTLIDGHNRLRAALELNLKAVPVQYIETETTPEQEKQIAVKLQVNRRNLNPDALAAALARAYPGYFDNPDTRGGDRVAKGHRVPLLESISKETGLHPKKIKRAKQIHTTATEKAKGQGRKQPTPADYKAAADEKKSARTKAESKKPDYLNRPDKGIFDLVNALESGKLNPADYEKTGLAAAELVKAIMRKAEPATKKKIEKLLAGGKK